MSGRMMRVRRAGLWLGPKLAWALLFGSFACGQVTSRPRPSEAAPGSGSVSGSTSGSGAGNAGGVNAGGGADAGGTESGGAWVACSTCSETCVDLETDAAKCGSCRNACPPTWTCSAGVCAPKVARGAPTPVETGKLPIAIVAGDWNGDGNGDLATASSAGSVSVLLGNGDGTFAPHVEELVGAGTQAIAVGDLNGDGQPDLVTANSEVSTVSVLLGNGDGTFAPHADYDAGVGARALAIGDFSGDERQDLVVLNDAGLSVMLGTGVGTLEERSDYPSELWPRALVAGDLNHDGTLDLAVVNSDFFVNLSVLLGQGDGTFADRSDRESAQELMTAAIGDFNGDGTLDLGLAATGGRGWYGLFTMLPGIGDGTFADGVSYDPPGASQAIVAGDMNVDGAWDLAAMPNAGAVNTLLGSTSGPLKPSGKFSLGGCSSLALGDLNGDGYPDLVGAETTTSLVYVLFANGDGTFG
jgi:hypothetical protein